MAKEYPCTTLVKINLPRQEKKKIIYKLVKAEDQKKLQSEEIKPTYTQTMTYGKSPTKRSITNVVDAVILNYKYASLPELNTVLKLYNLVADRGEEEGIIFKKGWLVCKALDEKGNKIGVPIKASSIYSKPTLSF